MLFALSFMEIQENVSLLSYNTFQVECTARYFVEVESVQQLQELIQTDIFQNNRHLVLGWWSNILLTSPNFDGIVIKNSILWKEIIAQDDTSVTIKVGWWENRNDFVERTLDRWYCWLENLISIPWSVGAAPMQNIWAYWVEVKSTIDRVEAISMSLNNGINLENLGLGGLISLTNEACQFAYRSSIFKTDLKNNVFITHVIFKLPTYNPATYQPDISYGAIQKQLEEQHIQDPTPQQVASIVASIRASKLPDLTKIWTAGSFFKNPIVEQEVYNNLKEQYNNLVAFPIQDESCLNSQFSILDSPVKLSAGQLIDLTGLKWITHWSVGTYNNHALVLVNHGWWTWTDIQQLASYIQEKVELKFWLFLEPEVNYIR